VLSGHTDVVPVDGQDWNSDPFSLTERGGRLYGRGTADMKGFIACCLAAVPALARTPLKRPIHLALSYDEEIGCLGVPRLLADLAANVPPPALAIVGEPTRMRIGDRHRGFFGYRTTFHGRAAHSSDPGAGASAIYPAAEFLRFLRTAGDDGGDGIDRTTLNVGRIDGGTAINIVPNRCDVVWEFRPSADSDVGAIRTTVDDFMARSVVHGVKLDHAALTSVPPLASRNDNAALKLAHYSPPSRCRSEPRLDSSRPQESRPLYAGQARSIRRTSRMNGSRLPSSKREADFSIASAPGRALKRRSGLMDRRMRYCDQLICHSPSTSLNASRAFRKASIPEGMPQ
jgi:acetylornithine deacetylase/succinyl-diaminopimelate desuccinylase-like protein